MFKKTIERITGAVAAAAMLFAVPAACAVDENGMLRVRLTRPGDTEMIRFELTCDYQTPEGKMLKAGTVITAEEKGNSVVLTADGKKIADGERVELYRCSRGMEGIRFSEPAFDERYCGDIELTAASYGIMPVLTIYVEDYLYGVVSAAMPEDTAVEAMKAQAIASRSYALNIRSAVQGSDYDLTDSNADQLFNGYDSKAVRAANAVDATRGRVVTSGGDIAACLSTASNGGQIQGLGMDNTAKTDNYDAESSLAQTKTAVIRADGTNIEPGLRTALISNIAEQLEGWGLSTADGDITIVSVDSVEPIEPVSEGSTQFTRLKLGLSIRSVNMSTGKPVSCSVICEVPTYGGIEDWYDLSINDADNETITVAKIDDGYTVMFRREGHGIGLSRSGAQVMATGYDKSCEDILDYYYPDTKLETVKLVQQDHVDVANDIREDSPYALPTLVPRATVEPTPEVSIVPSFEPTAAPTAEPAAVFDEGSEPAAVFGADEPEETKAPLPPLFAQIEEQNSFDNSLIAGNVGSGGSGSDSVPARTAAPTAANTKGQNITARETPLPDVFDAVDIPFDASDDLDLNVNDDSVLGAMDTGTEEEAFGKKTAKTTQKPGKLPSFSDMIDTDSYDDDMILGPKTGSDEPKGKAETAAGSSMKRPKGKTYGKVNVEEGSSLTLRSDPSVSAQAVTYLGRGTVVQVLAYDDEWAYVLTQQGTYGYLSRAYMVAADSSEAVLSGYDDTEDDEDLADFPEEDENTTDDSDVFEGFGSRNVDIVICDFNAVTTSNVRLHRSPSATSFTLLTLSSGEYVQVTAYNDEWAYVDYGGMNGFIHRDYLKKVGR